ncbi:PAS domain S-box protein [Larkinella humicola]|uniref:Sensory/regulatory protein RpfC n=1 Tax=Larkinella humicola TaxID=2607654 RepID=A0A5N1JME8_9BACT|nr:PAS domain S-box protein [Larkinella humicola]KAA9355153.1 PAS domain S-box protein [Larkinella humicola]
MPIPFNEHERVKALHRYQILDTVPEKEFDRLTELASLICQVPISLVSLIDDNRQWFKSRVGLDLKETSRDIAFCRYAILNSDLFEVEDATRDTRFKENPLVTSDPHIRFYAGYPLTDSDGYALGTLCVLDRIPRQLTESQQKSLRLLGDAVIELIIKHRQNQELKYLGNLFALSNDLICVAGTDGYFKKLNPAFHDVLGWDESYLLQTSFFDLVHPDDLQATRDEIAELASGRSTINFAHRFRCQNGTYRNLQWVATPEPGTGYLFAIARDITDEKEKELLLFQSENKFRSFFENSQGLMCIHDLEGKLLTVNSAGAHALGYEPSELVGLRLSDIVPEAHQSALTAYLKTISKTGRASGLMHTLTKDGALLIWLFNNILEKELNGHTYVIGNAIDITRRHQLEVDLNRTKEILEQTNEVARIGTWEVNVAQETVYWSTVTKAIHEVPKDYVPDFNAAVSFFKGKNYEQIMEAVNRSVQEGVAYDVELQIVTAKGRTVWIRALGTPEFQDGKCIRLYGTFQDIDERKKAEQALVNEKLRLAAFVEHAPAAVAMFDRDIRYIAVSNRWMEEYHLSGSVLGRSHYEVFPNLSDEWKAIHARCVNGAIEKNEEDIWRPEGWHNDQYLRWEVRPWYQFDGTIGGIMIFTQDITEICLQRDELKKAKSMAEQASLAKSEFLANMSHEIRTPLNGVIGFTDLVLKTALNTTQQQYLSIVNQSANTLLSIINDILDFSKIEAGKLELAIEKTDVYEISSQVADTITYQAQNKGLEVLLNLSVDLPRFVFVDSVRLKQVLVNLLGNAVKFTDKGEIELKITALGDGAEDHVTFRFEVRDTGIGIKPEMQERIFDAFSQEDPSTTKKYGGTGLGLTISNKLLGLMGSQLQLTSKPGEGSCFFFEIKLKAEPGDAIVWRDAIPIKNVLIVDDNAHNRLILRQMFLLKNIEVEEVSNGFEALQLLDRSKKYDVILMDYHMPYMDGLETIQKIRTSFSSSPGEQPIIFLHSSSDDEKIMKACESLAVNQRLVKPIKMQELYQALHRLVQQEDKSVPTLSDEKATVDRKAVKVLIVEDNKINLLLAKVIVGRLAPNAHILEAANGVEAVQGYIRESPDLILMDVQMPLMNGYEATQRIRELEKDRRIPIVALTAGTVKGEREKCLAAGMDDFLTKPIVEESLASLFRVWLWAEPKTAHAVDQFAERNAHFDLEVIKKMAGHDLALVRELVEVAGDELRKSIPQLLLQAEKANLAGLKAAGHKLYGTAVSAGMPDLAALARTLEYLERFDAENVNELLGRVQSEIELVLDAMANRPGTES